jgi:hypothetical protein
MTYVIYAILVVIALVVWVFLFRRKHTPRMPPDVYPGQIKYAVCEAMLKGMSNEEILEQQIGGITSDGSRGTKAWDDTLYYIEGLRNRLRECNPGLKI